MLRASCTFSLSIVDLRHAKTVQMSTELGVTVKELLPPLRWAITGLHTGPGFSLPYFIVNTLHALYNSDLCLLYYLHSAFYQLVSVMGKQTAMRRLRSALRQSDPTAKQ